MPELLLTYSDFIAHVDRVGVLAFYGKAPAGILTIQKLTLEQSWHTNDVETDPWQWKDRCAAEHALAFGCILNGHKGFLSKALYPLFYAAFRHENGMEERYEDGLVSQLMMQVYRLFEGGAVLSTSDVRRALGVTKKEGASAVDSAINALQKHFVLSVCGNKRKQSFSGLPYGWPANAYCLTEQWAGDWLQTSLLPREQAREAILDHFAAQGMEDRSKLRKALFA